MRAKIGVYPTARELEEARAENARLRVALERCVAIGEDWVNHSTRSMRDALADTVRAARGGPDDHA